MALGPLLRKEARWVRHNASVLAIVLLVLPAAFGLSTAAFHQSVPRDAPVAVVPADADVTEDEMAVMIALAGGVSEPIEYESATAARTALQRERVYGILSVPAGLYESGPANVTFLHDGAMVPYEQPAKAVAGVLEERAAGLPATVSVETQAVGQPRTLSEYFLATGSVLLVMVYAFAYVPYHVTSERRVFRRLQVDASLGAALASKGVLLTALLAVPMAALTLTGIALGYRVALLRPAALAVLAITFVALTAVSLGVTFLTRFRPVGRFLNVALLFAGLAFSGLLYPAGFFSAFRREVVRLSPLHHAAVAARGVALKELPAGLFADSLLVLAGVAVAALAWLAVALSVYQRRGPA